MYTSCISRSKKRGAQEHLPKVAHSCLFHADDKEANIWFHMRRYRALPLISPSEFYWYVAQLRFAVNAYLPRVHAYCTNVTVMCLHHFELTETDWKVPRHWSISLICLQLLKASIADLVYRTPGDERRPRYNSRERSRYQFFFFRKHLVARTIEPAQLQSWSECVAPLLGANCGFARTSRKNAHCIRCVGGEGAHGNSRLHVHGTCMCVRCTRTPRRAATTETRADWLCAPPIGWQSRVGGRSNHLPPALPMQSRTCTTCQPKW